MTPAVDLRQHLTLVKDPDADHSREGHPVSHTRLAELLEMPDPRSETYAAALPFAKGDTTAGVENELQTVVCGDQQQVDLPLVIRNSNYFKNITAKTRTGDTSLSVLHELENLLDANTEGVWENNWVRLPMGRLTPYAKAVFERDLLADKRQRHGPLRCDAETFFYEQAGETHLRMPISYLLKLAVADVIGGSAVHPLIKASGKRAMTCFLHDNTSPETHSFYLSADDADRAAGDAAAGETLLRYLFSHLLVQYSNRQFELQSNGQRAALYFAPHPHVRQHQLNQRISDAFHRDLFMSPCLSGWDCGEDKNRYMALCHRVLSRSQLNAVAKLKEAGIITRNLVVLPSTSNISLANYGTHLSIGSRKLSHLKTLGAAGGGLSAVDEKYYGDLAIKIIEHFLPLFVGTYTAAPYRLDFTDFHPEKVLGFLPHELEDVHLRMIWRRWKTKAAINFLGRPVTPFGPQWLDRQMGRVLGLKGDYVTDFRLIDYLVALQSTEQSPALDGRPGNNRRLKRDLAALGVFDESMPLYCLYRLRRQYDIGFNGFEGRYYSLFYDLRNDMARAAHLQVLLSALAYKYILAAAAKTRSSHRYNGFTRVHNQQYRLALIKVLRRDAADLIEMLGLEADLVDLENRLHRPHTFSAAHRLTDEILKSRGAHHPLELPAAEFNQAAEAYYRGSLKQRHLGSALQVGLMVACPPSSMAQQAFSDTF